MATVAAATATLRARALCAAIASARNDKYTNSRFRAVPALGPMQIITAMVVRACSPVGVLNLTTDHSDKELWTFEDEAECPNYCITLVPSSGDALLYHTTKPIAYTCNRSGRTRVTFPPFADNTICQNNRAVINSTGQYVSTTSILALLFAGTTATAFDIRHLALDSTDCPVFFVLRRGSPLPPTLERRIGFNVVWLTDAYFFTVQTVFTPHNDGFVLMHCADCDEIHVEHYDSECNMFLTYPLIDLPFLPSLEAVDAHDAIVLSDLETETLHIYKDGMPQRSIRTNNSTTTAVMTGDGCIVVRGSIFQQGKFSNIISAYH
jgi:hypothetical protein